MAGDERYGRRAGSRDPEPTRMLPGQTRRPAGGPAEPDESSYSSRTYRSSRFRRSGDGRLGSSKRSRSDNSGGRNRRPPTRRGPRRRPFRKILGVLLTLLLIYLIVYAGIMAVAYSKVNRTEALQDYNSRPEQTPGQDWLLVGSDSRDGLTKKEQNQMHTGHTGGKRADTMMLLHIPAGGGKATLVSFPRDSYVPVPGHGRMKLNAAYAIGGPKLTVKAIEASTGIKLDHYMEVGFGGFAGAVDAIGGVKICVKFTMHDKKQHRTFKKGCQEMDGKTGLAYVRSRYGDPRGDFGRQERQQQFLSALFGKAASPATLLNPFRAGGLAFATAEGVTVDDHDGPFDLIGLFWTMKSAGSGGVKTMSVPNVGGQMINGQSVVKWDRPRAIKLFNQLAEDEKVTVKGGGP